jgi:MutS domain V
MTAADWYRERAAAWTARHAAASGRATRLSRLRLVTFLGGIALIWWGVGHAIVSIAVMGGLALGAFGCCVVLHARVLEDIERADAALRVGAIGVARLARDWQALPEVPPPADLDFDAHPYARDLDIFGHASLGKWLGAPATRDGASRLASWLLSAADPAQVIERQASIEELAAKREWRERLAVEGRLTSMDAQDLARFLAWAESADPVIPAFMMPLAVILPITGWILFLLFLTDRLDGAWWLIPLLFAVALSFFLAPRIYATFDCAAVGQRALRRYSAMLSLVCDEAWSAPLLRELQSGLRAGGSAPRLVSKLARLTEWTELRTGAALLHFPIQAATLWDFHFLFALERWRARSGRSVRPWFDALASIDALATLAIVRADEPAWAVPNVDASARILAAAALGHPLIAADRRIENEVRVGPPGTMLLVTGSNMSGKSTLLRAIGLNTVLAQCGAPVCATSFTLPPIDLYTSIRVQDSLELGLSYFMAALARLKQIVDAALRHGSEQSDRGPGRGRMLMYLLDEVLQGTNSVERALAVRAVARHLLDAGAIGAMTTHDLALASEEPLKTAATPVHFTEQVHPDGTMTFDYRLRPGVATSSNALRLMQLIGIAPR